MSDIVVSGGFVVDGTGDPGRNADIGVNGDRSPQSGICGVGRRRSRSTSPEMVVAPGFVDIHIGPERKR